MPFVDLNKETAIQQLLNARSNLNNADVSLKRATRASGTNYLEAWEAVADAQRAVERAIVGEVD